MSENSKVWEEKQILPNGEVVNPALKPRDKGVSVPSQNIVPQPIAVPKGQINPPVEKFSGEQNPQGVATAPLSTRMEGQDMSQRVDQNKSLVQPGVSVVQPVNPYLAGSQMSVDTSLPTNLWEEQRNLLLQRGDTKGADAIGYGLVDRAFGGQVPGGARREGVPSGVLNSKSQVGVKQVGTPYVQTEQDATKSVLKYLTPEQDESKYAKENESMKKLLLLTDALRHLGNLVNVSNGATNQVFTSPVAEQEARYQTGRAQRAAQRSAQAKQAMDRYKWDAEQKRKDAEAAMKERDFKYKVAKDAAAMARDLNNDAFNQAYKVGQQKALEEHRKQQLELAKKRNAIAARNAAESARHNRVSESKSSGGGTTRRMRHVENDKGAYWEIPSTRLDDPKNIAIIKGYYDKMTGPDGPKNANGELLVKKVSKNDASIFYGSGGGKYSDYLNEGKANPNAEEMLTAMDAAYGTKDYYDMMKKIGATDVGGSGKYDDYFDESESFVVKKRK